MWSVECVCGSLSSVIMAYFFFFLVIDIVLYEASGAPSRFQFNQSLLEYVKFGALELVSIVSPWSKLKIVHYLFCWIPYLPRKYLLKFHNFCQPFDLFIKSVRIRHCFFG